MNSEQQWLKLKAQVHDDEKKQALDLFNRYDGGQFYKLVVEAGNDKNSEKGAAWDKFTLAVQQFESELTFSSDPEYTLIWT